MSLLNCRRKTSVHFSFWKLVLDLCLLCVVLFPRIGRCAVTYDICRDDETQAFLACQPPQADVVWYQTFNLTVSPETATCGNPPSTYSQLIDRTGTVQTCDASSPSLQHPPSFMVDESSSTWWQSINLPLNSKELQINITLTFNKTFLMAGDIVVTFNSGRPEQMVLEKSTDYGLTWKPLQYYARNCSVFSSVQGASVSVDNPTAVTCTNRFVEVVTRPPVGQKLKFQVDDRFNLFLGPNGANFQAFYSALENKMLDFLKFTDLRLRLIQPFTDNRGNNDMYYYGIADFRVFTWCDCNLHAAFCNYTDCGIVCDCQHHTTGKDCELCLPLYNDRPWRRGSYLPFDAGTANECSKCECNEHATSCAYNATYGRGVCEGCQHNTRGYHCQLCVDTFYPNVSLPLSDINICIDCDCDPLGVSNNSHTCAQVENPPVLIGQCPCRALVSGRRCDQCVPGYYGLKDGPSPGNCTACNCSSDGTLGQSNVCQQSGGQCPCKPNIIGRVCDTCADGFYSFPTGRPDRDCLPCDCNEGGSVGATCDKTSGQCSCKVNITGVQCNQVVAGSFVPMIDILTFEPKSGGCEVTSDLYTPQNPFDGDGFAVCNVSSGNVSLALETLTGGMTQKDVEWPYVAAVRYSTSRSDIAGTLHLQVTGNTPTEAALLTARLGPNVSPACPLPAGSSYHVSLVFTQGQSTASVSMFNNATLDIRCQYSMTLELYHYVTVNTSENSTTNATTNENTTTNVTSGGNNTTNVTTNGTPSSNVTANGNPTSNLTTNGTPSSNVTASGNATSNATANGTSNRKRREVVLDSGPPIVIDSVVFLPGLSSTDGSVAFQSNAKSENQSEMQQSYLSCLLQVAALSTRQKALEQSPCKDLFFSLQAELYGARTCDCNTNGTGTTLALSCQSLGGQCVCQPGVSGRTCDRCAPGYFNLTNNGCKPCNCHHQGAKNGACNNVTGQCVCYPNLALISDVIINPGTATGPTSTVSNSTGSNSTGFNSTDSNSTNSRNLAVDGTCSVCLPNFYGVSSGAGCAQCGCNLQGSTSLQCDETGQCPCKDSVTGHKCDICKEGYFRFSSAGCR